MYGATYAMLSSTIGRILENQDVYANVRKEIDSVLGREPAKPECLSKLVYLTAIWRETLRLAPSTPQIHLTCDKDTAIADGKYLFKSGTVVVILAQDVLRDSSVWGDDAELFRPERMLGGQFEALPPKAWIAFGAGIRGSMYHSFALQLALIALSTIIQRFEILPVNRSTKHSPETFRFRVLPRNDTPLLSLVPHLRPVSSIATSSSNSTEGFPLYVYYGSNTGSCEGFAQTIATRAARNGFRAVTDTLDNAWSNLPKDGPVIIITASFEGEPADNAGRFVKELTHESEKRDLQDVCFAVFGAGNHEWARTYMRIPRLIDATLELRGAKRLLERGEGDAGGDSFAESFYDWEEKLWETLAAKYGLTANDDPRTTGAEIQFVSGSIDRAVALRQPDARTGVVIENKLLTAPGVPPKHHIELKLPAGMTYQCGNYLAILPLNPPEYVERVLARFKILRDQQIVLNMAGPTTLPTGRPVSVSELLSGFVELGQFANKRNISTLLEYAKGPATRSNLEAMLADFKKGGKKPNSSMLALLEKYPDIDIPLGVYIMSLPPMRLRQYTISSSPLWNPNHATLTVGVIVQGDFRGVGSNYLGSLNKGDQVLMAVRPSAKAFHPPADPTIPMVLFAAGSGLAPFRGFLQERAMQAKSGHRVGKSVLFFGCRTPEDDYLCTTRVLACSGEV
ncbi:cytochrome P450 family protein [Ceratobasidium sp. AG-Ba]|nr:cytochrome P450 family protein [Ceratobasidium sp. AG-Ba]